MVATLVAAFFGVLLNTLGKILIFNFALEGFREFHRCGVSKFYENMLKCTQNEEILRMFDLILQCKVMRAGSQLGALIPSFRNLALADIGVC